MYRIGRLLVFALALGSLFSSPALAAEEWELLGTRRVSFAAETDVVEVTRREGRFNAIRIEVDNGTLEMYNLRVVFANGEDFSPPTRIEFRDGQRTRTIDLPGDARTIQKIVFRYKSRSTRGSGIVRVYGRKPGNDRGDPAPRVEGWGHIGAREVDFRTDHDVINAVGEGTFRSIMVAVEGADVEMFNVRVNFANGESFSPETRLVFEENTRSRVIDLPGAVRAIKSIEFGYRTIRRSGDGKAVVQVYGRK